MGACRATADEVSANCDRILNCTAGKLDYQKLESAGVSDRAELKLDEATEEELELAREKARLAMLTNGIVNVGKGGLSKREVELLIAIGFAERRPSGFNYRLFILEHHRVESGESDLGE